MPNRDETPRTLEITSKDFRHGEPIPAGFTCDGEDRSPQLAWTGVPVETRSFALICDDPDAPRGTWQHWLLYNLTPDACELDAGVPSKPELPSGARQGINDFGNVGYGGPCPPVGRHRYFHKLYALDTQLGDLKNPTKATIEQAMQGHVLEKTELVGTYQKGG